MKTWSGEWNTALKDAEELARRALGVDFRNAEDEANMYSDFVDLRRSGVSGYRSSSSSSSGGVGSGNSNNNNPGRSRTNNMQ